MYVFKFEGSLYRWYEIVEDKKTNKYHTIEFNPNMKISKAQAGESIFNRNQEGLGITKMHLLISPGSD